MPVSEWMMQGSMVGNCQKFFCALVYMYVALRDSNDEGVKVIVRWIGRNGHAIYKKPPESGG